MVSENTQRAVWLDEEPRQKYVPLMQRPDWGLDFKFAAMRVLRQPRAEGDAIARIQPTYENDNMLTDMRRIYREAWEAVTRGKAVIARDQIMGGVHEILDSAQRSGLIVTARNHERVYGFTTMQPAPHEAGTVADAYNVTGVYISESMLGSPLAAKLVNASVDIAKDHGARAVAAKMSPMLARHLFGQLAAYPDPTRGRHLHDADIVRAGQVATIWQGHHHT